MNFFFALLLLLLLLLLLFFHFPSRFFVSLNSLSISLSLSI